MIHNPWRIGSSYLTSACVDAGFPAKCGQLVNKVPTATAPHCSLGQPIFIITQGIQIISFYKLWMGEGSCRKIKCIRKFIWLKTRITGIGWSFVKNNILHRYRFPSYKKNLGDPKKVAQNLPGLPQNLEEKTNLLGRFILPSQISKTSSGRIWGEFLINTVLCKQYWIHRRSQ